MHTRSGRVEYVTHLDIVGSRQPRALGVGAGVRDVIDGVVLERPRSPMAVFPAPIPPSVGRFHLRVPDDVATILGAAEAHRNGQRGAGVTVAMVDSGWYRHPFFTAHGYAVETPVTVIPGTNPARDPHGHGTGESANVFAIAPECTLRPYRAADDQGNLVGALAAFVRAKQASPTCSRTPGAATTTTRCRRSPTPPTARWRSRSATRSRRTSSSCSRPATAASAPRRRSRA